MDWTPKFPIEHRQSPRTQKRQCVMDRKPKQTHHCASVLSDCGNFWGRCPQNLGPPFDSPVKTCNLSSFNDPTMSGLHSLASLGGRSRFSKALHKYSWFSYPAGGQRPPVLWANDLTNWGGFRLATAICGRHLIPRWCGKGDMTTAEPIHPVTCSLSRSSVRKNTQRFV